jgi:hypothetical protein
MNPLPHPRPHPLLHFHPHPLPHPMTVRTTFPCKILNNGKEPCEPLMTSSYAHHS